MRLLINSYNKYIYKIKKQNLKNKNSQNIKSRAKIIKIPTLDLQPNIWRLYGHKYNKRRNNWCKTHTEITSPLSLRNQNVT